MMPPDSQIPVPVSVVAVHQRAAGTVPCQKPWSAAFDATTPLFRKTSCAVAYAHGLPDYNGHYGIRELCDICSLSQLELCAGAHRVPSPDRLREVASTLPEARGLVVVDITDRAAVVSGLETEQPRYYLQHALSFQVHDVRHPHVERRHGRADIGWKEREQGD